TGHALELLRMPERILVWTRLLLKSLAAHRKLALAREAAVKIAELEVQARELAQALKNSRKAALFAVMLAEPLPDRETEDLLRELKRIGLFANALFVNRVLMPEEAANCRRCMRTAQGQARVLAGLKKSIRGTEIYLIRNFGHEVAGKDGLRELTQELWRLQ
ncbi:MAG TPA: ArsA-related P-loop ATPase, partial [Terriglobales bacterium]|nr:ArsA-related P-loop ATPase [Terriglobales bacterium]